MTSKDFRRNSIATLLRAPKTGIGVWTVNSSTPIPKPKLRHPIRRGVEL